MLSKQQKDNIIAKFKTHKGDTGSPEVQIALLSAEIDELTSHLKRHKKDQSSRRGLLKKVGQRRRLLRYLAKENPDSYTKLTSALGLKAVLVVESADILEEEVEVPAEEPAKEE